TMRVTAGICRWSSTKFRGMSLAGTRVTLAILDMRTANTAHAAPRSRSTSSAMRWPSIAAGIPQERDQQQNVANLFRRAAVGERAVDVDAKLVRAPDRRRHRDRGQRFGLERQRGPAPDVAIGISVDHVLQRLAERAERVHALIDRVAAEHLPAK